MTPTITKSQAIDLWFKFLESDRVKKDAAGYGPGGKTQFFLILERAGKTICQLTLIADSCHHGQKPTPCGKGDLYTPYGNFILTPQDAYSCRTSWIWRDKTKGIIPFDDLLTLL